MRMLLACPEPRDAQRADSVLAGTSISEDGSQQRLVTLPAELVERLLGNHLIKDLEELHAIFSEVEVRMRGASLLLVYEGDPGRLGPTLDQDGAEGRQPGQPQVRLIDFGHATLVPGQGPDQGVLLGVSTTLELARKTLENLEQRRKQQPQ